MGAQAEALFSAMVDSGRNFVVIAPNNDPGSNGIFKVLDSLPKERFRVLPSMRFAHFSELMKHAACMVGNSSAGVREAPFMGIPSLDVGTRQSNRSEAGSVTSVSAFEREKIMAFLAENWGKSFARDEGFGEGRAADRFVQLLDDPTFWAQSLQKSFNDIEGPKG